MLAIAATHSPVNTVRSAVKMAADKSFSDIDLAEFQTPNRRASGLIKGAEAFHRISDEPEPEDAFMPALGLSPIKEYVEGKSGMLSISLDGVEFNKFRQRPSKKLNPIWYGPFTVTGRPSSISVEVKIPPDSSIHNVFTLARVKLASDEQFSNLRPSRPCMHPRALEPRDLRLKRPRSRKDRMRIASCSGRGALFLTRPCGPFRKNFNL